MRKTDILKGSIFWGAPTHAVSLNFQISCCTLKIRGLGAKLWLSYYFYFERNYGVLKSKSPCFLLEKCINFNKHETESKMENPIHSFKEMNFVLQHLQELRIKSKTVMSWSLEKKKECIFCNAYFVWRNFFFHICVLSQCIVY